MASTQARSVDLLSSVLVPTGKAFASALADPAFNVLQLTKEFTQLDSDDFDNLPQPVMVTRNVTIRGWPDRWLAMSMGHVKSKVRLANSVTLTIQYVVVSEFFNEANSASSADLLLPMENPASETATVVLHHSAMVSMACFPPSLASAYLGTDQRPSSIPGTNSYRATAALVLNSRVPTLGLGPGLGAGAPADGRDDGSPQPCSNDTSAAPLERCWAHVAYAEDYASRGRSLNEMRELVLTGHLLHLVDTYILCRELLSGTCIQKYNPIGCMTLTLKRLEEKDEAQSGAGAGSAPGPDSGTSGDVAGGGDLGGQGDATAESPKAILGSTAGFRRAADSGAGGAGGGGSGGGAGGWSTGMAAGVGAAVGVIVLALAVLALVVLVRRRQRRRREKQQETSMPEFRLESLPPLMSPASDVPKKQQAQCQSADGRDTGSSSGVQPSAAAAESGSTTNLGSEVEGVPAGAFRPSASGSGFDGGSRCIDHFLRPPEGLTQGGEESGTVPSALPALSPHPRGSWSHRDPPGGAGQASRETNLSGGPTRASDESALQSPTPADGQLLHGGTPGDALGLAALPCAPLAGRNLIQEQRQQLLLHAKQQEVEQRPQVVGLDLSTTQYQSLDSQHSQQSHSRSQQSQQSQHLSQHSSQRSQPDVVVSPLTPLRPTLELRPDVAQVVKLLPIVRGRGAYGKVYEGLYGGERVAVKVMDVLGFPAGEAPAPAALAAGEAPAGAASPAAGGHGGGLRVGTGAGAVVAEGANTVSRTFAQEVEVLGRCQHPNVVRLLAACLTPPRLCLVMELMETSLQKLVFGTSNRELLPFAKVLHIATEVARGLEYLHPTIVHRDLKLDNILLARSESPTPTVKVTDFGLSRLRNTVTPTRHPEAGTPAYMAPECFDVYVDRITHHVDVYSWGVVLWTLLTSVEPWEGLAVVEIAYRVTLLGERLPPVNSVVPGRCPRRLQRLLDECWNRVPQKRPAAAEVVKQMMLITQQNSAACASKADAAASDQSQLSVLSRIQRYTAATARNHNQTLNAAAAAAVSAAAGGAGAAAVVSANARAGAAAAHGHGPLGPQIDLCAALDSDLLPDEDGSGSAGSGILRDVRLSLRSGSSGGSAAGDEAGAVPVAWSVAAPPGFDAKVAAAPPTPTAANGVTWLPVALRGDGAAPEAASESAAAATAPLRLPAALGFATGMPMKKAGPGRAEGSSGGGLRVGGLGGVAVDFVPDSWQSPTVSLGGDASTGALVRGSLRPCSPAGSGSHAGASGQGTAASGQGTAASGQGTAASGQGTAASGQAQDTTDERGPTV